MPDDRFKQLTQNQLLTPDEMMELQETEEGREFLKVYIIQARSAMAAMRVMDLLEVVPPSAVQQEICNIIFTTLWRVDLDVVMRWLREAVENKGTQEAMGQTMGNA